MHSHLRSDPSWWFVSEVFTSLVKNGAFAWTVNDRRFNRDSSNLDANDRFQNLNAEEMYKRKSKNLGNQQGDIKMTSASYRSDVHYRTIVPVIHTSIESPYPIVLTLRLHGRCQRISSPNFTVIIIQVKYCLFPEVC